MDDTGRGESSLAFERLVFFSDAVFAIVITLLVLPLAAEVELPETQGMAHQVLQLWPKILTFAVSFLVIGQFWIAHHRMFDRLERYDSVLLWLNLLSLLTVSFMPFPTAVLGANSTTDDKFPVVFYAASMTMTSIVFSATWLYAQQRRLVDPSLSAANRREFTIRALLTSGVFLLSVLAAFLGLYVAIAFWLVLLPAARILVGRAVHGR